METRANYLMIGGFILGALALIFMFVFWVANIAGGGNRYQIIFDSSVAGLTTGSRVGFNGIKVGGVQSFELDPQDARKVRVVISVTDDTPIREDSLATIKSMGLAGGSGVEISPGSPESPLLLASEAVPIPTIRAAPMAGAGIFGAVEEQHPIPVLAGEEVNVRIQSGTGLDVRDHQAVTTERQQSFEE